MLNELLQFIRNLGAGRIAAIIALTAIVIGLSSLTLSWLSREDMLPLYNDLRLDDASKIIDQLESSNIQYTLVNQGRTILAPASQVVRLRMRLAENNLPSGGNMGYELFDRNNNLGVTSFVQNINHTRALEGELARSIKTIAAVREARVHLVLPERRFFTDNKPRTSASIILKLIDGLNNSQIKAIQHLVAAAVADLQPTEVAIINENGDLLAASQDLDNDAFIASSLYDKARAIEKQKSNEIIQLVEKIVGRDRVKVALTIELNGEEVAERSDNFDPESKVTRSIRVVDDQSSAQGTGDGVSVGNELPNSEGNAGAPSTSEQTTRSEEITNYEISKTTVSRKIVAGTIKRQSIAVLVDGKYVNQAANDAGNSEAGDEANTMSYLPRSEQEIRQITDIVSSATGLDEERGDTIKVINMRFTSAPRLPVVASQEPLFNLSKADYFNIAEIAVVLIIGLLSLLFIIRPLVKRITAIPEQQHVDATVAAIEQDGNQDAISGGEETEKADVTGSLIKWAEDNNKSQSKSMAKISELIETNPLEATNIIREWLKDAA